MACGRRPADCKNSGSVSSATASKKNCGSSVNGCKTMSKQGALGGCGISKPPRPRGEAAAAASDKQQRQQRGRPASSTATNSRDSLMAAQVENEEEYLSHLSANERRQLSRARTMQQRKDRNEMRRKQCEVMRQRKMQKKLEREAQTKSEHGREQKQIFGSSSEASSPATQYDEDGSNDDTVSSSGSDEDETQQQQSATSSAHTSRKAAPASATNKDGSAARKIAGAGAANKRGKSTVTTSRKRKAAETVPTALLPLARKAAASAGKAKGDRHGDTIIIPIDDYKEGDTEDDETTADEPIIATANIRNQLNNKEAGVPTDERKSKVATKSALKIANGPAQATQSGRKGFSTARATTPVNKKQRTTSRCAPAAVVIQDDSVQDHSGQTGREPTQGKATMKSASVSKAPKLPPAAASTTKADNDVVGRKAVPETREDNDGKVDESVDLKEGPVESENQDQEQERSEHEKLPQQQVDREHCSDIAAAKKETLVST